MSKTETVIPNKMHIPESWFKIEVDSNGSIYELMSEFLGNLYKEQGGHSLSVFDFAKNKSNKKTCDEEHFTMNDEGEMTYQFTDHASESSQDEKKPEKEDHIPFHLPHMNEDEWIELTYDGKPFRCALYNVGMPVATMSATLQHDVLYIACPSLDIIEKLIYDAKEAQEIKDPERISIYMRQGSHWSFSSFLHKRKIDSVFIPKRDELISDIRKFRNSEQDYLDWGIPYKRNYFFYGPPGTGKTSIITAIASEFNLNVHICSFSTDLDDSKFSKLMSSIRKDSILVLEDIDALFRKREKSMNSQVSFSCILNTLDGLQRQHGLMTFMTTNHKEELDDALTRPGRIDMSIKFDFATKDQIKDMFENFLPSQKDKFKTFYKKIQSRDVSTAVLQKFLFEKRECEDIMSHLDYFDNLCSQYGSNEKISEGASSMYQ